MAEPIRELSRTACKYGMVGLINTAVSIVLMAVGAGLGLHYAVYTAFAYAVGMLISFGLNLRFTFRARGRIPQRFLGFVVVCAVCLAVAQAVQALLIESAGTAEIVGVGTGMVTYTGLGFILNRALVFRSPAKAC
jgi:putative flippase GtrA